MRKRAGRFVYWTPRILSIVFIAFLAVMSLDVFDGNSGFWNILLALFMHNIPVFILTAVLIISWNHEIVGGISFIIAGLFYIGLVLRNIMTEGFEWYYLAWVAQISGIAFFIGILFLLGWFRKRR